MESYRFLMNQHVGMPSIPLVRMGDRINRGQIIAGKTPGAVGSNIHSSINGRVLWITDKYIEIEKEFDANTYEYVKLKGKTPLELLEEAGIVGLGGAGFPTYIKLQRPFKQGGKVIVNAAECEPVLTHNILMIEKKAEEVIRGIHIVMKMVNAEHGIVAMKRKHKKAIEALKKCISDNKIQIHLLPDMYPMGEERAVIRQVENIALNVEQLPAAANTIVINAETIYRIYEAVDKKKPLIDKDITVAGKLRGNLIQVFKDVPIGIRVGSLIDKAGGCYPEYGEIIMGDHLREREYLWIFR